MKCYMTAHRLELVGKAWEIRSFLQQWLRETDDPQQPLQAVLQRRQAFIPATAQPIQPQRSSLEKKQDLHLTLVPSL